MSFLSEADTARLEAEAQRIRASVITMLAESGSGHLAGSLGMADVFTSFYFDPKFKPSFTQKRLMEAGFLGRKSRPYISTSKMT